MRLVLDASAAPRLVMRAKHAPVLLETYSVPEQSWWLTPSTNTVLHDGGNVDTVVPTTMAAPTTAAPP